jgi:hypothetical protein
MVRPPQLAASFIERHWSRVACGMVRHSRSPRSHTQFPARDQGNFGFLVEGSGNLGGVAQKPPCTLLYIRQGTECPTSAWNKRRWDTRGKAVIGKQYFVRQAAILFGIAKATKDPKMSAALMDKAADVKSKVDELGASLDLSPRAPDIDPPAT